MRFSGYAALFDVADRGGDVIRRGAFADAGAPIPLLWQHDPKRRIGTVESLSEDGLGLKIDARVDAQGGCAREVAMMLSEGRISGLSFGYRVRAASAGPPGRGGMPMRELTALDVIEVSLVANPMQPGARVIALSQPQTSAVKVPPPPLRGPPLPVGEELFHQGVSI